MKTIVLGDIHGRTIWKDILEKENLSFESNDKIIFLGDYVSTHDNILSQDQIINLENILTLKKEFPKNIILLRGNHDIQHLGYHWAECSGYFREVAKYLIKNRNIFLKYTQWIYIEDKFIFSHAGISKTWLQNTNVSLKEINNLPPSELFGFTPDHWGDVYGESKTQPCTWIRPSTLITDMIEGYTQFIGHTPVTKIFDYKSKTEDKIWLCDCLANNQYIVIENNKVNIKEYVR